MMIDILKTRKLAQDFNFRIKSLGQGSRKDRDPPLLPNGNGRRGKRMESGVKALAAKPRYRVDVATRRV